jgi:alpha-glucosidase
MLLLTLRGTPVLLYGDELGMVDQPVPRDRQRDLFGLALDGGVSHDPTRTPMPWSAEHNAGFSAAPEPDLWLPVARDYETVNVEAQLADEASMLSLYRALLALRRESAALRLGGYAQLPTANGDCLVYAREVEDERILVALNLTDAPRSSTVEGTGEIVLSTALDRRGESVAGDVELRASEGLIIGVSP